MASLKNLIKYVRIVAVIKMKTKKDPRHKIREKIIKELFAWGYQKGLTFENKTVSEIIKKIKRIDNIISKSAPQWPIKQINRIDLAILRLAVWELIIASKEPPKVIIDEAVELAKDYGGEKSPAFVNGVLGTVLKNYYKNGKLS